MKLFYATSIQFPSRRANRLQTIAMAGEFQKLLGNDFYLGGTDIKDTSDISVVNFPGTTKSFLLGFKYARFISKEGITHVYTREERLLFFIKFYLWFFGKQCDFVYEAHFVPSKNSSFFYFVLRVLKKIVVLTKFMKEALRRRGIKSEVLVAPDGVDIEKFSVGHDKHKAREILGLPLDKKIIMYTGHLYAWKGVDTLAQSASFLGEDCCIVFVGGTEKDIANFKEKYGSCKNIVVIGHRDHDQIPTFLSSANVLVLPNSSKEDISKFYTSPLKLFEYMASGVPIVASDLPSLREILNEENALLVSPDNSQQLAQGIMSLLSNKELAYKISSRAKHDVLQFSWKKRADEILRFIQN